MSKRNLITTDQPETPTKEGAEVKFIGYVENESGRVEISAKYRPGLEGLRDYSHAIILYWFHKRDTPKERETLQVTPRRHPGAPQVGVFSTRSPSRPNPIGLCIVELVEINGSTLIARGLDALAGSPIIDIKPYNPRADSIPNAKIPQWAEKGPQT
jgi:tRNA-Thr(GGU) m(6)t(6)A37 methyltransferase TsaA